VVDRVLAIFAGQDFADAAAIGTITGGPAHVTVR
jgi:hypothetical protein